MDYESSNIGPMDSLPNYVNLVDHSLENLKLAFYSATGENFTHLIENLDLTNEFIDSLIKMEPAGSLFQTFLNDLHRQTEAKLLKLRELRSNYRQPFQHTETNHYFFGNDAINKFSNIPAPKNVIESKQNNGVDKDSDFINSLRVHPLSKGLADIIGLSDIKKSLRTMVLLPKRQPQLYNEKNICNSVLLFGPPGTGKTKIAHAIAAEAQSALYCLSASDILSKYVGQTERTIKTIFRHVTQVPGHKILFIDEIDGLCRKRTEDEVDHVRRLKVELLSQFNDIGNHHHNVFVICATNCPWDLDVAFIKRFQRKIYVPLPNNAERLQFLLLNTNEMNVNIDMWADIINATDGFSCSDLENLVQHALLQPLTELEGTKLWSMTHDGFYEPYRHDSMDSCFYSDLTEIPDGKVRARKPLINDFMSALNVITKSIPDAELKRYQDYMKNM